MSERPQIMKEAMYVFTLVWMGAAIYRGPLNDDWIVAFFALAIAAVHILVAIYLQKEGK